MTTKKSASLVLLSFLFIFLAPETSAGTKFLMLDHPKGYSFTKGFITNSHTPVDLDGFVFDGADAVAFNDLIGEALLDERGPTWYIDEFGGTCRLFAPNPEALHFYRNSGNSMQRYIFKNSVKSYIQFKCREI